MHQFASARGAFHLGQKPRAERWEYLNSYAFRTHFVLLSRQGRESTKSTTSLGVAQSTGVAKCARYQNTRRRTVLGWQNETPGVEGGGRKNEGGRTRRNIVASGTPGESLAQTTAICAASSEGRCSHERSGILRTNPTLVNTGVRQKPKQALRMWRILGGIRDLTR